MIKNKPRFVAVITGVLVAVFLLLMTVNHGGDGDIPVPFADGPSSSLRGEITLIGRKGLKPVKKVMFSAGQITETLQSDTIYLVRTPDDPNMPAIPLNRIVHFADHRHSVNYFGYKYVSVDAAEEKANRNSTDMQTRFPGQFFASAPALAGDAGHGGALAAFAASHGIDYKDTDVGSGVLIEPDSLYMLVVNDDSGGIDFNTREVPCAAADCSADIGVSAGFSGNGGSNGSRGLHRTLKIGVHNYGSNDAENVQFNLPVPQNELALTSVAGASCQTGSGQLSCDLGLIPGGQGVAITAEFDGVIAHQCAADVHGQLVPTVTTDSADTDVSNNQTQVNFTAECPPSAKLWIDINQMAQPFLNNLTVGDEIDVPLSIANQGPNVAPDVQFQLSGADLQFISLTGEGISCHMKNGYCIAQLGNMPFGERKEFSMRFRVIAGNQCLGNRGSIASAYAYSYYISEPSDADYRKRDQGFRLMCPSDSTADLGIVSAQMEPSAALSDETAVLDVTIKNFGPAAAENARLTILPSSVTPRLVPVSITGATCILGNGACNPQFGTIASGATVTFKTTYRVPEPRFFCGGTTTFKDIALPLYLQSDTPDPDPSDLTGNNRVDVGFRAECPPNADLSVTSIMTTPNYFSSGQYTDVYVTAVNNGPDDASEATVTVGVGNSPFNIDLDNSDPACTKTFAAQAACTFQVPVSGTHTYQIRFLIPEGITSGANFTITAETHAVSPVDYQHTNNARYLTMPALPPQ